MDWKETIIQQWGVVKGDVDVLSIIQAQAQITGDIAYKKGEKEGARKLVEWADEWCEETRHKWFHADGANKTLRRHCSECWQAYLKELEEGKE